MINCFKIYWSTFQKPGDCASLPYQEIVRWAFAHKSRVLHVLAHDESYLRNRFMRFFLTDTRNETMARTVHNIYSDYPESMVVAYGGMAHMLKSGRYLYDLSNRTPLGARLKKYGLSRFEVTTVIVSGGELAPIDTLFKKEEIIPVDQEWNSVLPSLFLGFSTFGIARPQDAFDYFVHLPTLTLKSAPFDGSCKIPPFRFSAPWI